MKLRTVPNITPEKRRGFIVAGTILMALYIVQPHLPSTYFYNFSLSGPPGVYVRSPAPPSVGQWVVLPSSEVPAIDGIDPNFLLKQIIAVSGDSVSVSSSGVYVNGVQRAPGYPPDAPGRNYQAVIADGYVFLANPNPYSYDSRYFGPVPVKALQSVDPVWVFTPSGVPPEYLHNTRIDDL